MEKEFTFLFCMNVQQTLFGLLKFLQKITVEPIVDSLAKFTIERKGMPFDNDFCYSFPLFTSLLKKEGRRKGESGSKIRDQKSNNLVCFSQR